MSLRCLKKGRPVEVVVLFRADAPGEQTLREMAPDQRAHPVALGNRKHLTFDCADEQRVWRLLGVEPFQAAPLRDPLGLDNVGRGHRGCSDRTDLSTANEVGKTRLARCSPPSPAL